MRYVLGAIIGGMVGEILVVLLQIPDGLAGGFWVGVLGGVAVAWMIKAANSEGDIPAKDAVAGAVSSDLGFAGSVERMAIVAGEMTGETVSPAQAQQIVGQTLQQIRDYAEQGNAEAQVMLGHLHYKGDGLTQSPDEALKWYRRAVAQGHAEAQVHVVDVVALRLWAQLMNNIEYFPKENFVAESMALEKWGSSLERFRTETFRVQVLAFEFPILNNMPPNEVHSLMDLLRTKFIQNVLRFVTARDNEWGGTEEFLSRLQSYRIAISEHMAQVRASRQNGNILEPIFQVFWQSIQTQHSNNYTGKVTVDDVNTIKNIADQVIGQVLEMSQIATEELVDAGLWQNYLARN